LEFLVVVPLAVVVPPFGPLTVAVPVAPVLVLVAVAVPLTVFPRALVAVPVAVAEVPLVLRLPVAVPPRRPVTVCCASAIGRLSERARIVSAVRLFVMEISFGINLDLILRARAARNNVPGHFITLTRRHTVA
jgi:dihydroorotase-like cyclic amidohydrolase